jgi:hypothetical protein
MRKKSSKFPLAKLLVDINLERLASGENIV